MPAEKPCPQKRDLMTDYLRLISKLNSEGGNLRLGLNTEAFLPLI